MACWDSTRQRELKDRGINAKYTRALPGSRTAAVLSLLLACGHSGRPAEPVAMLKTSPEVSASPQPLTQAAHPARSLQAQVPDESNRDEPQPHEGDQPTQQKGWTLSQALMAFNVGDPAVALVNSDLITPEEIRSIPPSYIIALPPKKLVAMACLLVATRAKPIGSINANVFDGATAHAVLLVDLSVSKNFLTYWDVWGRHSFLEAANNAAGVAATLSANNANGAWVTWDISLNDMERVLHSMIVYVKDLRSMMEITDRLTPGEFEKLLAEYRKYPGDSYDVSELRLAEITVAYVIAQNWVPAMFMSGINKQLHPHSAIADDAVKRVDNEILKYNNAQQGPTHKARRSAP